MFTHNLDPVFLTIGPLQIHYYSIAYILGFLLGYWFLRKAAENKKIKNFTKKKSEDFIAWLIVGVVLGGRLGYFLFYNISYFWQDPLEILMIWHGGMSFHGGLIGACLFAFWFLKKNKIPFYEIADVCMIPTAIGLGLGRIANFINGEIVGIKSSLPWCVNFENYDGCRHPVQIYLALKNFAVAGLLWFLDDKKRKPGYIFWQFVLWYGAGRFLLDFLRVDPAFLGISTGQFLSLLMVVLGGWMLYKDKV